MPTTSTTRSAKPRARRTTARAPRAARTTASSLYLSDMPTVSERPPRRSRTVELPAEVLPAKSSHVDVCVNCAHLPMSANALIAILAAFTVAVSSILLASSVIIGAQATRIEALQGVPAEGPVAQR